MPYDPSDPRSVSKIRSAINASRAAMKPWLELRQQARKAYVGRHYGQTSEGSDKDTINPMETLISTLTREVVAKNPQVTASTSFPHLVPTAAALESKLNKLIGEIDLRSNLRMLFKEAMMGLGVMRVGVSVGESRGWRHQFNQPYADVVSLEDFCWDMRAHSPEQCDYMAVRYRLPLDEVKRSPLYDPSVSKDLSPTSLHGGRTEDVERDKELELATDSNYGEYRQYVELWDCWLPWQNLMVTLPDEGSEKALRVVTFDGPEEGPLQILSLNEVPGSLMPLPPAARALDLHEYVVRIFRKVFRDAEQRKDIPWYQGQAAEDMRKLLNAAHQEPIRVDHANAFGNFSTKGASPQDIATALYAKRMFSEDNGNLDLLGGLSTQAETLGQESILNTNASRRVQDMQDRFSQAVEGIIQKLAWYAWTDPLREEIVMKRLGRTNRYVQSIWSPETREGDLTQYDIKLVPFSMQYDPPQAKANLLLQMFQFLATAGGPLLAQQGITPDLQTMIDLLANWRNLPELKQVLRYSSKPLQLGGGSKAVPSLGNFGGNGAGRSQGGPASGGMDEIARLMSVGTNQFGGGT